MSDLPRPPPTWPPCLHQPQGRGANAARGKAARRSADTVVTALWTQPLRVGSPRTCIYIHSPYGPRPSGTNSMPNVEDTWSMVAYAVDGPAYTIFQSATPRSCTGGPPSPLRLAGGTPVPTVPLQAVRLSISTANNSIVTVGNRTSALELMCLSPGFPLMSCAVYPPGSDTDIGYWWRHPPSARFRAPSTVSPASMRPPFSVGPL